MKATTTYKKAGESDIWLLGSGKPLVVIHGGPGLDHSYLVDSFSPLGELRKIIFYNQLGSGQDNELPHDFTVNALVSQFVQIVQHVGNEESVDVIAHSWGAYIFYESLKSSHSMNIGRAILVSPVGLTRNRFDGSGERLIARIPEDILASVEAMEANGEGAAVMNMLAPFYFGEPRKDVDLVFTYYNPDTYFKVAESLGEFDCSDIANYLPRKTSLVYGECDIELPEDTKELQDIATLTIIPGAGHFSFAEKPTEFIAVVRQLLTD
ncbi:MAG: alpha/beta fold hydrolase [Pedobacter sp.]